MSELTPEDASSTFAATPPLESPKLTSTGVDHSTTWTELFIAKCVHAEEEVETGT